MFLLTHLFPTFSVPLKTSENRKIFGCFHEIEKEWIGNKLVHIVAGGFDKKCVCTVNFKKAMGGFIVL